MTCSHKCRCVAAGDLLQKIAGPKPLLTREETLARHRSQLEAARGREDLIDMIPWLERRIAELEEKGEPS